MNIEQPTIKICDCKNKCSIEPHDDTYALYFGDTYALYFGRCNHKHGYNLAQISECSHNCNLKEIERLLNRADV